MRPARLKVGIISAGRVGTALGVALERADHVVVACSAISGASRRLAERRLPDTPVLAVPDVAEGVTVVDSEVPAESDAVIVGVCVLAAEAVAEALGATDAEAMGQTSTNRRRRF